MPDKIVSNIPGISILYLPSQVVNTPSYEPLNATSNRYQLQVVVPVFLFSCVWLYRLVHLQHCRSGQTKISNSINSIFLHYLKR